MDSLDIVLTVVALIVCLLLVWASIKFLISINKSRLGGSGSIKVRQSHYLSSRERLVVVEYRDQNFLLGVGGAGITLIDKSPVVDRDSDLTDIQSSDADVPPGRVQRDS